MNSPTSSKSTGKSFKVGDIVTVNYLVSQGDWNASGATIGVIIFLGDKGNTTKLQMVDSKTEYRTCHVYTDSLVPHEIMDTPLFKAMNE